MILRMEWVIVLIAFQVSYSQSVVQIGHDYSIPDSIKVPYGKKVLLKGKADNNILSVKVNWMYGINEGSKDATISHGAWSVIVGPFPTGESVIIQFRVARTLPKDTLRKYVTSTLDKFSEAMAATKISMSDEELTNYIKTVLVQSTAIAYKRIQTSSGTTLFDLIVNSVSGRLVKDQRNLVNALWREKEMKEDITRLHSGISVFLGSADFDSLLKQTQNTNKKDAEVINAFVGSYHTASLDTSIALKFKDILSKSSLTNKALLELTNNRVTILIEQYATLTIVENTIKTIVTDNIDKTVNDLQLVSEYSSSFESSVTISDLEYYAGFDVGYFVVSDKNVYPFFTVNIYPQKVEINKDPKGYLERLSLSAGIAIKAADIQSNGLVYTTGIGFRINKFFRITAGTAFYQDITTKKIKGEYTAGLSLNFRYITDLLQIVNGATANFQTE